MTTFHPILKNLEQAVFSKDPDRVDELFQDKSITDLDHALIVNALTQGLETARKELGTMTVSVAEFLLSVDAMRQGFEHLKKLAPEDKDRPKAVIGVIKGDVHVLGANIIAGVMEALGYDVKNLGQDTDVEQFLSELKQSKASILGLSSMMSTTLADMKETIARCKRELPNVKIIVGGACLDENLAKAIGSDGYAASAAQLPETLDEIERLIDPKKTSRKYVDYDRKIQVIESS
ncbi:MAG: cobalamin-dependent protein [Proteobacteria bacterium]|nr:cobalamin-dependent protein [Pseudomonadota bacterium]